MPFPARKRVRPPRKSTTQARREEKASLLRELDALGIQLRRRRARLAVTADATPTTPTPRPPTQTTDDAAAVQRYQRLLRAESEHHLWIAGLRGLLRSYEMAQQRPPLHVPLVLTADPVQRRETLRRLHAGKIRDAHAYVLRQCGSLDLARPYTSFDKCVDAQTGAPTFSSLEIVQFPGVDSVRKVYDAMEYWMSNVELCITDALGTVTIREDDEDDGTTDSGDSYCSLRRVRSTLPCGVSIEGNFAIFRQFLPSSSDNPDPYAVLTIQAVDDDPLFPYHPDEHVKVAITGGIVISSASAPHTALARWASVTLGGNGGDSAITADQAQAIGQDAARWLVVLQQVIRERVYAQS